MSAIGPRHDDGTALVMVLVFVLVVAVVVGALLDQSYTTFRSARVTSQLTDRVMAANGGAEWGLQQVRVSARTANGAPACARGAVAGSAVPGPTELVGSPLTINGRQVTVTCQATTGESGIGGWSLFVTNPAGGITLHAGGDPTKVVSGAVHNAGPFTVVGAAGIRVADGDLLACNGTPPAYVDGPPLMGAALEPGEVDVYRTFTTCAGVSEPAAPASASSIASMAFADPQSPVGQDVVGTRCRVFEPGRYTALPAFVPTASGSNYLRSGVYYLDDLPGAPSVLEDVVVVGGAAGPRDVPLTGAVDRAVTDGCPLQSRADTDGHDGVVLVFGGRSRLEIRGDSLVELYGYVDEDASVSTPGATAVSVHQLRTEWGDGERSTVNQPSVALIATGIGSRSQVAVHGAVYAPLARVSAFGTGLAHVSFLGGVVAAGIDLQASALGPSAVHISDRATSGARTIRITSTTNSVDGEKDIATLADVVLLNDAPRTLFLTSWVVEQ